MQKEYKTILNHAVAEYEEKKSKFITTVKPVNSEEEAVEFINELKAKYWDATHNVYSYYICGNNTVQRFSDDGEPSGTAGMPVMEVIKRMGVQDLVVVVTRYFGGTLLGAAGLIRAYSKSASLGIEAANVIRRQLCVEMSIVVEYTLFGKVQNLLINNGYTIKGIEYTQDVEVTVFIPVGGEENFINLITEATNARAIVEPKEKVYITLDESGKLISQ
ncbi:MAG: YigZ family protein [Clostridia bacterium]|nr:YigZ family protein [Clostridia bacterium]